MSSTNKVRSGRKPLVFHYGSAESHNYKVQKSITDKVDLEIILFEPKRKSHSSKDGPKNDSKSPGKSDTDPENPPPEEDSVAHNESSSKATKSPLVDKRLLDQMESRFRGTGGANGENIYIDYMDYF